jgi:branched-chain amino acid transport system substrate-binding protein
MNDDHPSSGLSRRAFLRSAGLAAGALAAAPLLNATPAWAAGPAPGPALPVGRDLLTIGVLLPRSTIYPALGGNFLAGMQLYFNQATDDTRPAVRLVAEDAGFGRVQALAAAQKLLDTDKAALVVGLSNPTLVDMLRGLFQTRRAVFLTAGLGENVPRAADDSAYVFHHSLGAWQAAWALGRWAATHLGRRAAIAGSLYDSGYDAPAAFRLGFTAAGGAVTTTQTTHLLANSPALPAVLAQIAATRPDFIYAAYCGPAALDFVRAAQAGPAAGIPLLGSPFLAGETALPTLGKAALGIKTALGWTPALDTAENRAFLAAYAKQTGQAADNLALLGYETARLVALALAGAGGDPTRGNQMRAALAAATFTGPRGAVAMDAQTHCTNGPLYLREVQARGGALANVPVATLPAPAGQDGGAQLRATIKSGWTNAYLSI